MKGRQRRKVRERRGMEEREGGKEVRRKERDGGRIGNNKA